MNLGTSPQSWHHKEAFEQGLVTTDAISELKNSYT